MCIGIDNSFKQGPLWERIQIDMGCLLLDHGMIHTLADIFIGILDPFKKIPLETLKTHNPLAPFCEA